MIRLKNRSGTFWVIGVLSLLSTGLLMSNLLLWRQVSVLTTLTASPLSEAISPRALDHRHATTSDGTNVIYTQVETTFSRPTEGTIQGHHKSGPRFTGTHEDYSDRGIDLYQSPGLFPEYKLYTKLEHHLYNCHSFALGNILNLSRRDIWLGEYAGDIGNNVEVRSVINSQFTTLSTMKVENLSAENEQAFLAGHQERLILFTKTADNGKNDLIHSGVVKVSPDGELTVVSKLGENALMALSVAELTDIYGDTTDVTIYGFASTQ